MENIKTSLFITPLKAQSKYSVFKRMANLSLLLVGVIICINLWLLNSEQANNWHKKQTNQLGESLSALASKILINAINHKELEKLAEQLAFIVADSHVLSASVYDEKGKVLAENNAATSVVAIYKLEETAPLVFVKAARHQGKLVGYLRIMLDENEVMKFHSEYQLQLYQQLLVLMILAAVVGILVARVFYKFRYRLDNQKPQSNA